MKIADLGVPFALIIAAILLPYAIDTLSQEKNIVVFWYNIATIPFNVMIFPTGLIKLEMMMKRLIDRWNMTRYYDTDWATKI
ncbi:MAG: hypothetical protein V1731_02700 [Candidatus Aenigmatarchaeota archaeon]